MSHRQRFSFPVPPPRPMPAPGLPWTIAGYYFGLPVSLAIAKRSWRGTAGVYTVWDFHRSGVDLLDVGLSHTDLRDRLANHKREPCWEARALGRIVVRTRLIPGMSFEAFLERQLVESTIRERFRPPCGVY